MVKVGKAISFLTFSGFASTGFGRGDASTPERRPAADMCRPKATAGPCAGLSGRLSTLPRRLWQASRRLSPLAAALLSGWAGPAGADALGDRIAEALCYPATVRTLTLVPAEAAAYRRAAALSGRYRDTQGRDARAWFDKSSADAVCRTGADLAGTLSLCWPVTFAHDTLNKDRARLCP